MCVCVSKARQLFHMNFMALAMRRIAKFLGPVVLRDTAFEYLHRVSADVDDHIESKEAPKITIPSLSLIPTRRCRRFRANTILFYLPLHLQILDRRISMKPFLHNIRHNAPLLFPNFIFFPYENK